MLHRFSEGDQVRSVGRLDLTKHCDATVSKPDPNSAANVGRCKVLLDEEITISIKACQQREA